MGVHTPKIARIFLILGKISPVYFPDRVKLVFVVVTVNLSLVVVLLAANCFALLP